MKFKRKHIVIIIVTSLFVALCLLNRHYKLFACNVQCDKELEYTGFSLMTFNIAESNPDAMSENKQRRLLDLILQEKPDILCFQELSFENLSLIKPSLDSIYGPCDILKGEDQLWRLRFYSRFPLRNFCRHKCIGDIDTLGMSDIELSEVHIMQKRMGMMSAEFEVEHGKWIKLFSGHLRSSAYSTARRSMPADANWFEGLSLYWRNYQIGKRMRNYEAQNVSSFIAEARGEGLPVMVAGDLNDWCGSECLNTLMGSDLKDAWWEGGNGFGWTYFGWHLRLRLDHILYSKELELVDVKVVDIDLSDHKPLVARFKLNER